MTFARRVKDEETINSFLKAKGETLLSVFTVFTPFKISILTTEKRNQYYFITYRDTSAMCCIAKIN